MTVVGSNFFLWSQNRGRTMGLWLFKPVCLLKYFIPKVSSPLGFYIMSIRSCSSLKWVEKNLSRWKQTTNQQRRCNSVLVDFTCFPSSLPFLSLVFHVQYFWLSCTGTLHSRENTGISQKGLRLQILSQNSCVDLEFLFSQENGQNFKMLL